MARKKSQAITAEAGQAKKSRRLGDLLEKMAHRVSMFAGGNAGFASAVLVVLVWIASGPVFGFSNTWQLVINTGTTIVTFIMVFLIQRTQNKDARAVQLKLNELVAALEGASNRMIAVEELSEHELEVLSRHYHTLAQMAQHEANLTVSHSVEEAEARHRRKYGRKSKTA